MLEGELPNPETGKSVDITPYQTLTVDVPARHYKLEISDEADDRKALIDIPLSFSTDQIPLPEGPGGTQPSLPIPAPVGPK